jgi:DHA1 family multidrug resistance protein B-like MFS transporter
MTIYLNNYFGLKITGLMVLFNIIISIILSFLSGYFADRYGRKKLMLIGQSLSVASFAIMTIANSPLLTSPNIPQLLSPLITFAMMTVNTISWAISGPAMQALLIDYTTMEERKFVFSFMYWANNLSMAVGTSFGGFLFEDFLFILLIALTISSVISLLITIFVVKDKNVIVNKEKESAITHIKSLLSNYKLVFKDKLFVLFNLALIFVMSMEFQLSNYVGIRLSTQITSAQVLIWELNGVRIAGLLRTENTIIVAFLALIAVRVVKKFKDRNVLIIASSAFVLGYAIISYTNIPWLLFSAMLIASLGEVMRVPVEENYLASLPPRDKRSSYMAVNSMTYNISTLICSFTILISAYLNSLLTSIFIAIVGFSGIFILIKICTKLDERVLIEAKNEELEQASN